MPPGTNHLCRARNVVKVQGKPAPPIRPSAPARGPLPMSSELTQPDDLRAMLEAVRRIGRPRIVGGGVRDWLLGLAPKDFDIEVAGADFETMHRTLEPFGATDVVGRSFGVIKVRSRSSGEEYDFSLPRRESKTGAGHRGFAVAPDPTLSDAAAAARRDFTINAIAVDPFTGAIIDPHDGRSDLAARRLRHTRQVSPALSRQSLLWESRIRPLSRRAD